MKEKTSSGFEFQIDKDVLDDYELLEDLVALDNGEGQKIVRVIKKVLGDAQSEALKEHLRKLNGKVRTSDMAGEIKEIFDLIKKDDEAKNS